MFFRKNTAHNTSLFTESKQNTRIYDVMDDTEVLNFNDFANAYLSILSSSHLAMVTKNHLVILDPFNLQKISSTLLDIGTDEQIINVVESANQLQIILSHANQVRIIFYDINHLDSPKKSKEINKTFIFQPNFIFYINGVYILNILGKAEIRDNDFSLLQSLDFNHSFLWGIAPISSTQFLSNTHNAIYLWTKENNTYHPEKLFSKENHVIRSMIYHDGKIIYSLQDNRPNHINMSDQVCIYDLSLRKNVEKIIPQQKIYSINNTGDVIALHLDNHIELRNIGQTNEMLDTIPLKKSFKGYIVLLNNMSVLCCDMLTNKIEMVDFPKLVDYRDKLDKTIEKHQPKLIKDLRQIIGEYAIDPSAIKTSP